VHGVDIREVRTLVTTPGGLTVSITQSVRTGSYAIQLSRPDRRGLQRSIVIYDRELNEAVDAICDAADLIEAGEVAAE
jgi:hypothetical protein